MSDDSVLLFVDEIEDDVAWLLVGEKRHQVPRTVLPFAAREGTWLRLSVVRAPDEAQEIETRRQRLTRVDPGGKVKL